MNIWFEVFLTVFALFGIWSALYEVWKCFTGGSTDEIYVYFTCEKAECGEWDIIVSSPDEERILKALGEEYKKIYIQRGVNRWAEKKKKGISKERSRK
ncbi:MAG: hypothetical protein PHW77_00755 [Eubacteriales bacterium]|nr:hypothetical protein [Eubacteriales bacterium]